jgi:DNA helicase-2/ATP-dependent DNA helicase PcrA
MFAQDVETPGWLAGLNDEQRAAVLHGDGPLLVVAGAGSGKTRTLAARVARLIADGASPDRILLLTFTRRAAAEMLRRAGAMVRSDQPGAGPGRVWGGTFHSIANRLLRRHGEAVGLRPAFTVLDQGDAESLFSMVRAELGFGQRAVRFPKPSTIAAIYSRVVNAQTPLTVTLAERYPWCADHAEDLKAVFKKYTATKRSQGVADYDDLLLYWRALLESPVGAQIRGRFDHVLVDEYQDTNRIQADILRLLCGPDGNLTVVGDDAQAIYSFRAADVENILGFADAYPGARVVTLEENYRSTPEILHATNAVIAGAGRGFAKHLRSKRNPGAVPQLVTCLDPEAEAAFVCDMILERREHGIALRDQAVLFRTGHHSDTLEVELARRRIPFVKFGGLKFLEAAHVKDLLAMLRILDNPGDELAWHRVLQMIPGVGPATARKVLDRLDDESAATGTDRVVAFLDIELPVVAESVGSIAELRAGLTIARESGGPGEQIEALLPFCETVFERAYDDAGARLADLTALSALAAGYSDRSRFITELILDPPNSTSDLAGPPHLDDDYLVLSTIHSAKGGEWEAVYVIHAADGNIPSDMALSEPNGIDEERRIFYVALTRAKQYLSVTVPQRFYHRRFPGNPNHSYALASRFLTGTDACFETATEGVESIRDEPNRTTVDPVAPVLDALFD